MCVFDDNGFISGQIQDWIDDHENRHKALLATAFQLNRECHKFLDERSVSDSSRLQVTTAVLFARMMEMYQGILIVVGRGMMATGRILFRALLEAFFNFEAIHKDPDFLEQYLNQFQIQRKALVNRIRNSDSPELAHLREPITDDLVSEIRHAIEEEGITKLTVAEVARKAGLHGTYLTAYATLSGAVHTSSSDLESLVEFDNEDRIAGYKYGPSDEETRRTICLTSMAMADALRTISNTFGEDRSAICQRLRDSFEYMLNPDSPSRTT